VDEKQIRRPSPATRGIEIPPGGLCGHGRHAGLQRRRHRLSGNHRHLAGSPLHRHAGLASSRHRRGKPLKACPVPARRGRRRGRRRPYRPRIRTLASRQGDGKNRPRRISEAAGYLEKHEGASARGTSPKGLPTPGIGPSTAFTPIWRGGPNSSSPTSRAGRGWSSRRAGSIPTITSISSSHPRGIRGRCRRSSARAWPTDIAPVLCSS